MKRPRYESETKRESLLSAGAGQRPKKGTNPHFRVFPFEAQHFVRIVSEVLQSDLNLKKRGHASASVDALLGLLQPFMHQPVTKAFAKRVRAQGLGQMYGNAKRDITLMPGMQTELERCGYIVHIIYKNKVDMRELALAAQKVRSLESRLSYPEF